jgi:hypothetical protein
MFIERFKGWTNGFIDEALLQPHRMRRDKQILFTSFINLYR